MKDKRFVGVKIDGVITVHAPCYNGNYDTLCGIDASDSSVGHQGLAPLPWSRARIGCPACKSILRMAWKYRAKDLQD